jgi:hypothetical protein
MPLLLVQIWPFEEVIERAHHAPMVVDPVADRAAAVKRPAAAETVHVVGEIDAFL